MEVTFDLAASALIFAVIVGAVVWFAWMFHE